MIWPNNLDFFNFSSVHDSTFSLQKSRKNLDSLIFSLMKELSGTQLFYWVDHLRNSSSLFYYSVCENPNVIRKGFNSSHLIILFIGIM